MVRAWSPGGHGHSRRIVPNGSLPMIRQSFPGESQRRQGGRTQDEGIAGPGAVHLEVGRILSEPGADMDSLRRSKEKIHGPDVTGFSGDNPDPLLHGCAEVAAVKAENIAIDLFGTDASLASNPDSLKLAVEQEHGGAIGKGHVVFDGDTLIPKSTAGMGQKQSRGREVALWILPDWYDGMVELPAIVRFQPSTSPAMALVFPAFLADPAKVRQVEVGVHTGRILDQQQTTHML